MSVPAMRLDVFSHNIKATGFDGRGKAALFDFCTKNSQWGYLMKNRQRIRGIVAVYAAATKDRTEFRFHRHQYEELLNHLTGFGISQEQLNIVSHPPPLPVKANFKKIDERPLFDYQVPLSEYFIAPGHTKVITLQTGKGKTRTFLESVYQIGNRVALVIKGMYVEKWTEDVENFFGKKKGKLLVVRGSAHLKGLMHMALDGELEANFIIITNTTIQNYLREWEHNKFTISDYPIKPEEMYEKLGVGVRGIDEVHQDFHLNYRQDLYTHVEKTISLSATLKSDDEFIRSRYRVLFPQYLRTEEPEYDKYIAVTALGYEIPVMKNVKYKEGKNYSHTAFEKSVMRNKEMLRNYLNMIHRIMKVKYIDKREEGQKMLIFAATIDLCTIIVDFLKPMYPDLKISRYTGEDDYDNLMTSDITVTTIKSAGTAVDVEGLITVLMTDSINSIQANIQVLGRLRKLKGKWAGVTPEFLYVFSVSIDKQVQYHMEKIEKFNGLVLGHKTLMTPYKI